MPEAIPAALIATFSPLLQVPLSEKVTDTLAKLQEVPIIYRTVTVLAIFGIALAFLERQFKLLDSLIGTWQSIQNRLASQDTADQASLRKQLLAASKTQVLQRLEDTLNDNRLIPLTWEDQPRAVGRVRRAAITPEETSPEPDWRQPLSYLNPRRLLWQRNQTTVTLAANTQLIEVFQQPSVKGRLLILGAPGAGKTTTLLELAQALITAAETDATAPVPIIFELSAWKQDQPMAAWLAAQLQENYSVDLKRAQHWVQTQQILPLLDGLDELGLPRQTQCIARINDFLPAGKPSQQAVVCCRTEEFHLGNASLDGLNGAVELQPLTAAQIQGYLNAVQRPRLWSTIQQNPELMALAQRPLMLTVMVVALARSDAPSKAALFEAYIAEQFDRYEQQHGALPYSRRQTRHYLTWLAQRLRETAQTEFLIEGLQPFWLTKAWQMWAYRLIVGLILGLIVGLILGLIGALIGGLIGGLIGALILGLIGELDRIEPIEILEFSLSRFARKTFFRELLQGLIGGLKGEITIRTRPNQGIRASAKNALVLTGLGVGLAGGLSVGLSALLPMVLNDADLVGGIVGVAMFAAIWIPFQESGGQACMQHVALRLVLWGSGVGPRDYAHFLRYTSELRFTRQTGGRYRFLHDLLREHFATHAVAASRSRPSAP